MTSLTAKDKETVRAFWAKVSGKAEDIGKDALNRMLIVYPPRHFTTFGNVSTNAAILGNPKVAQHGKTVMGGLENAVKNLDDIKNTYAKLSRMHSEKLHVDPDNFRALAECISVCVAAKFGKQVFTADVQEAWQKFLSAVVSALGRQYH
uniref:Hemoglobin subunit epsilon 1 n=1 Tax=Seriola lalandi dorsalis TaxID=1841481 RepID=A0A3B4XKQ7_SERLL